MGVFDMKLALESAADASKDQVFSVCVEGQGFSVTGDVAIDKGLLELLSDDDRKRFILTEIGARFLMAGRK